MSALRTAAQHALEALHNIEWHGSAGAWMLDDCKVENAIHALRAALAETVPDSKHATIAAWWADKQCPNCASLQDQNTELDRKLAEMEGKPLTDEEIEKAYREIWRDLPSDFDHTSAGWIEMGIRYAEKAHGINYEYQDNKR